MRQRSLAAILLCMLTCMPMAHADESVVPKLVKVNDRVYALVGDLNQRSPQNLGNNMTHGFIIGDSEVVVVDTGG